MSYPKVFRNLRVLQNNKRSLNVQPRPITLKEQLKAQNPASQTFKREKQPRELGKKYESNFIFTSVVVKVRYGGITTKKIFKHRNYLK